MKHFLCIYGHKDAQCAQSIIWIAIIYHKETHINDEQRQPLMGKTTESFLRLVHFKNHWCNNIRAAMKYEVYNNSLEFTWIIKKVPGKITKVEGQRFKG